MKPAHPATNIDLRKYIGAAVGAFTLLTSGGVFAGAQWVVSEAESKAKSQVDAGVAQQAAAVKSLETKLDEHIKDEALARRQQAEATNNTQLDIRELYRSMQFGGRSKRLEEAPPKPLLEPDAGR